MGTITVYYNDVPTGTWYKYTPSTITRRYNTRRPHLRYTEGYPSKPPAISTLYPTTDKPCDSTHSFCSAPSTSTLPPADTPTIQPSWVEISTEIFHNIPAFYKPSLEDSLHISQAVEAGNLIACSDGSHTGDVGAHGWVLSTAEGTVLSSDSGPVDCHPSLRTVWNTLSTVYHLSHMPLLSHYYS